MDKLNELFAMQEKLGNTIFQKKGITDNKGNILTFETIRNQAQTQSEIGPNTEVNDWLRKFLEALDDESRELKQELLWKWWSKDHLDMQNIRVEIIDQLHFWMSLAITAGLDADKVYDIYMQKNKVNFQRQETDYSKTNKNESDNKQIK